MKQREKKLQAFEMKKAGWSARDISKALGIKVTRLSQWLRQECQYLREHCSQSFEELLLIESERYDALMKAFWNQAVEHHNYKAAEIILKLLERKAKLLGLDAPEKQMQLQVTGESSLSNQELLKEMELLGFSVPQEMKQNLLEAPGEVVENKKFDEEE